MHLTQPRATYALDLDLGWPGEPTVGHIATLLILLGIKGVADTPVGRFQLVRDIKAAIKLRLKLAGQAGRKVMFVAKYPESPEFLPDARL